MSLVYHALVLDPNVTTIYVMRILFLNSIFALQVRCVSLKICLTWIAKVRLCKQTYEEYS